MEDRFLQGLFLLVFVAIISSASWVTFSKLRGPIRLVSLGILISVSRIALYYTSIVPLGRFTVGETVTKGIKLYVVQYPAEALFFDAQIITVEPNGRRKYWRVNRDEYRWPSVHFEESNSGKVRILRGEEEIAVFDSQTTYLWVNGNIHEYPTIDNSRVKP